MNGIVFGLIAATFQSLSYLFSRAFLARVGHSPRLLLAVSHVSMGVMAGAILPFTYPGGLVYSWELILSVAGTCGFYLLGQMGLFIALRHMDASRLAPLLGAKIIFLALTTVLFGGHWLSSGQWAAVILAAGGVYILNEAGGRLPWRAGLAVGVAIVSYSLSDLFIVRLVQATGLDNWNGALFGMLLTYIMCGLAMAPLLAREPAAANPATWVSALLYSISWFVAMIFLFACFAEIGAVFGNIVQSTRGFISILLGVLLMRLGYTAIEHRVRPLTLVKRVLGACAMTAAIALYLTQ